MTIDSMRSRAVALPIQRSQVALWISSGIFLACYIGLTLKAALVTPLWMDEVLSVWTARLPSMQRICSAVEKGSGFSPPVYHLALHYYSLVVGGSNLALRSTSIAGVLLTAALSFILLRRHLGTAPAVFASCLIMESLSPFGLQVRPYTLVTTCYAAALLLWDDLNVNLSWRRALIVGFPLAVAISLHFYAVLLVPGMGIIEILRFIRTRERRTALWIALVAAGASIFLWLPYMRATYQFNARDVNGATNGPRPTFDAMVSMYSYLFQGVGDLKHLGKLGLIGCIVISALFLIMACKLSGFVSGRNICDGISDAPHETKGSRNEFWDIVVGTLLVPLIIFLFSLFVTKTFNLRYVIAGSIGAGALYAEVFSGFPCFRRILPAVLLIAAFLTIKFGVPSIPVFDHSAIYGAIPGTCPIVVADGSQFFQLEESAPPGFRSRLIYLIVPPGTHVADANDMDAIERWKGIEPNFPVENSSEFLSRKETFYVLDERTSDDTPMTYLYKMGLIEPLTEIGGAMIYRSRPWSPNSGR